MKSAIYSGQVRHRRFSPKKHAFSYSVFMMYVCLNELDEVLSKSVFWSRRAWSAARFKREDFHGDPAVELSEAVKRKVESEIGRRPEGNVFMLANFRYFGVSMNPLVTYYCFDKNDQFVDAILAEVTNTPWRERRAYVLDCCENKANQKFLFEKNFTVSPFNTMDMCYTWYSSLPGEKLNLHIDCSNSSAKVSDATLQLTRDEISGKSMTTILAKYPFMTLKVLLSIYWQALKLFCKGVPFLGKNKQSDHTKKSELEGYEVH